jgi:hypothetical protein
MLINGIISFASQMIFHKSDAKRPGLESANAGLLDARGATLGTCGVV